jgi:hypothetical protein
MFNTHQHHPLTIVSRHTNEHVIAYDFPGAVEHKNGRQAARVLT